MYCKKKSRELHRVKSEEVKRQTAKRICKKNDLRERQKQKSLNIFKDASWITNNSTLHDSGTRQRKQWMSLRKLLHNPIKRNV